jgi:hypothetical protein
MTPTGGKRWTVRDRYGHSIYLTQKQWEHIIAPTNHPEMVDYEDHLKETIRLGQRRQEPLNPRKYRYVRYFNLLLDVRSNLDIKSKIWYPHRYGKRNRCW